MIRSLVLSMILSCGIASAQNYRNLTCWGFGGTSCNDRAFGSRIPYSGTYLQ
jgi:hypothetical protein